MAPSSSLPWRRTDSSSVSLISVMPRSSSASGLGDGRRLDRLDHVAGVGQQRSPDRPGRPPARRSDSRAGWLSPRRIGVGRRSVEGHWRPPRIPRVALRHHPGGQPHVATVRARMPWHDISPARETPFGGGGRVEGRHSTLARLDRHDAVAPGRHPQAAPMSLPWWRVRSPRRLRPHRPRSRPATPRDATGSRCGPRAGWRS